MDRKKYLYEIKKSKSKDFPIGKKLITSDLDQRTDYPTFSDIYGKEIVFYRIREMTDEEIEQKRETLRKEGKNA